MTPTSWARAEAMLRIPCPHCGERDYTEFRYGGDATKVRPAHGSGDLQTWHDHVFLFDNPKGAIASSGSTCKVAGNGSCSSAIRPPIRSVAPGSHASTARAGRRMGSGSHRLGGGGRIDRARPHRIHARGPTPARLRRRYARLGAACPGSEPARAQFQVSPAAGFAWPPASRSLTACSRSARVDGERPMCRRQRSNCTRESLRAARTAGRRWTLI